MSRKIAYVINPKSGGNRKTDRAALIRSLLPAAQESTIFEWKKVGDRDAIFDSVRRGGFDVAMAVGGDGTVSQLAHALCGTSIALGIVPFGSGNGLARHLGIPLKTAEAMQLTETGIIAGIDRGIINGRSFFCTAGLGFDARIGKLFAESAKRGFSTYAKMTLKELRNYKGETYTITLDGKTIEREAFLVTAANAGQYGNNAWIAPEAKVNDGLLHLSILRPFRWWNIPGIASKMFNKTITRSAFLESHTAKNILIRRSAGGAAHYDGEPDVMSDTVQISIEPNALKVLVPAEFRG